jgi:integrase
MRKAIIDYTNQNMNDVVLTLSKHNQALIKDFLEYCKITAGDNSIKKISNKIVLIGDTFEEELDKLTLENVRAFLVILNQDKKAIATKNDIKKVLKRFIKWKYPNWSLKFNQLLDVKLNTKQERRDMSKGDLLTPDEMRIIVNSVESLKFKTILLLMQESANRPEEILKLKWKDINLNTNEVKLNSAKTGETRTIPIKETVPHLIRYKKECFFEPPRNEDYVFPSLNDNKEHLKPQALNHFLFELEKRLKFKKHLYPYLWRHSILSKMIKTLSPKVYEMYAGHSLETGMNTYSHLDNDDLREELYKKVFEIEELTKSEREDFKELKEKVDKNDKQIEKLLKFFQKYPDIVDKMIKRNKLAVQEIFN